MPLRVSIWAQAAIGDPAYKEVTADYKANKGIWDIKAVMLQEQLDTLTTAAEESGQAAAMESAVLQVLSQQHRSVELLSQHQPHCSQKRHEHP